MSPTLTALSAVLAAHLATGSVPRNHVMASDSVVVITATAKEWRDHGRHVVIGIGPNLDFVAPVLTRAGKVYCELRGYVTETGEVACISGCNLDPMFACE